MGDGKSAKDMLKDMNPIQRKRIQEKAKIEYERIKKENEEKERKLIFMLSKEAAEEFENNTKSNQEINKEYFGLNEEIKKSIIPIKPIDENERPKRKLINKGEFNKSNKKIKPNEKNEAIEPIELDEGGFPVFVAPEPTAKIDYREYYERIHKEDEDRKNGK